MNAKDAKRKIDEVVQRMGFLGDRNLDGEVDLNILAECVLRLSRVVQYLMDEHPENITL
jgi:hypothetical protein